MHRVSSKKVTRHRDNLIRELPWSFRRIDNGVSFLSPLLASTWKRLIIAFIVESGSMHLLQHDHASITTRSGIDFLRSTDGLLDGFRILYLSRGTDRMVLRTFGLHPVRMLLH